MNNNVHIEAARAALARAAWVYGQAPAYGQEAVSDLLADLRHFCIVAGLDFDACCAASERYFTKEREPGYSADPDTYVAALSLEGARAWLIEHDPAGAAIWMAEASIDVLRDNVTQNLREYGFTEDIKRPGAYEPVPS